MVGISTSLVTLCLAVANSSGAADTIVGTFTSLITLLFALPFLFVGVVWLFAIGLFVVNIIIVLLALIDCAKRENFHSIKGENAKLIWILIILFGGLFGAIAYYFAEKRNDRTEPRYSPR